MSKKRRVRTLDETAIVDEFSNMQNEIEFGKSQHDQVEEEGFLDQELHHDLGQTGDDVSQNESDADGEGECYDFEELQNATEELLVTHDEESGESVSPRRGRKAQKQWDRNSGISESNRSLLVIVGSAVMAFGLGIAVVSVVAPGVLGSFGSNLQAMGLTSGLLVTLGIAMTLVSQSLLRQESLRAHIELMQSNMIANDDYVEGCFDYLVDAHEQNLSRRPASGEELEQVLHNLQRQDEKINNLTKALKMYGKPLVEVNRHVTEVGLKTKAIATQVEAIKPLVVEMADHLSADIAQKLAELPEDGTDRILENIATLGTKLKEEISQGLDKLPKDEGTPQILDALNREIGSLNNAIANLSFAPQPTAPAPSPRVAPPSQPSAPQSSGTHQDPSDEASGLANSISGSKTGSGKSVTGAIAKLKRMRP